MYSIAKNSTNFPNNYAGFPVFGFNGKENDNEVYGSTGTFQDYGMRMYDTRVARFISVDPISKNYPWYTPYQFAGNKPIWALDLDGLEEILYNKKYNNIYFKALLKVVDNTTLGKEFKNTLKNQNKIDVYYYPLDPFYGERGLATLVNNQEELNSLKTTDPNRYYYNNVNIADIKESINKGKKVLMIGITEQEINNMNDVVDMASDVHHEEVSHGINILKGKSSDVYADHQEYNSDDSYYSPTSEELESNPKYKNSPALKGLKEIKEGVKNIIKYVKEATQSEKN